MKEAEPEHDLVIGRLITFILLVLGMLFAPFIGDFGGIYFFIQTLLSLFQGPMLALLIMGAFSTRTTPAAGVITILTGVALAATMMLNDMNMLYVAAISFVYAIVCLLIVSRFTESKAADEIESLVYRWRGTP